jgi:hypothetical protein
MILKIDLGEENIHLDAIDIIEILETQLPGIKVEVMNDMDWD